ncbi:MAG: DEAD/DEAH box helicase family protein [Nannocystis sp.]|nr:DEAD/DEAH box helicase family protein [Nannocystis sp.]
MRSSSRACSIPGAQGGTLSAEAALAALVDQKWNLDGEDWDEAAPADAYLTGVTLWQRHDRARPARTLGTASPRSRSPACSRPSSRSSSPISASSARIMGGSRSTSSPAWVSATMNRNMGALTLVREGGLISAADGERSLAAETMSFLGWLNHDNKNFTPIGEDKKAAQDEDKAQAKRKLAEKRIAMQQRWAESFYKFLAADESRQEEVVYAYNRAFRGRIVPQYPAEPLSIVRWGQAAPQLKDHQIAGARRVLAQRGGLVAFDVGVGKTYTALAVIARARQEGWVRRPVVLVPGSLVWKWHDDVLCTLPDYRIRVIGSKRKILSRGPAKGQIVSETDTPEERARKWIELQTGQLDLVILSYDALPRTKMNVDAVLAYAEQVESIERSLNLRRRNLKEKASAWAKSALTERQRALLEHGTRAWVEETLALPEGWEYDPGVTWDEIGVDMLIVDEAASFKTYMPGPREDGGVPRFMGSSGDGSNRAWQLDFRAAAVRRTTGGAGIVLLTATPAKNSPLELYNLIQFVDPNAFLAVGIHDPEQFIDHFLKIEYREVLDSTLSPVMASAVTGFINLDELRTLILTYGEFRTAAEVNLKLPRPVVETITVTMDDAQEEKYVAYVKAIEAVIADTNPKGSKNVILGLLARLGLVALHANLDEGYTFEIAREGGQASRTVYDEEGNSAQITVDLPRPVYDSPKLVECAKRIIASPHCGHIVFAEPTAVHVWMKEVLIEHGIPAERIAWLNPSVNTLERTRIARDFNGLSSETPAPGTCTRPPTAPRSRSTTS